MITINGSVPVDTMYGPRKRLAWWEWPIAVVVIVVGMCVVLCSASAQDRVQDVTLPHASGSVWTIDPNIKPSLTIHMREAPDAYVTIHPDGTIEYGKGYTPDATAKVLWDAVGVERAARNCKP